MQQKLNIKVGCNEEDIKDAVESGPIDTEWAFMVFKARRNEPAG